MKVLPPRDAAVAARPETQERTSTGREQEILRSLETASAAKDAQRVWGEKEIRGPTPVSYTYTCSVSGRTYRETLRSPRFWKMVLHDRIIQTDNYLGTYTLSVWGPRSPHQLPTQHSVPPSAPKPPATLITRLGLSIPPPLTHSFQCIPRFLLWQAMMCILGHALTLASKQITSPAEILPADTRRRRDPPSRLQRLFQDRTGRDELHHLTLVSWVIPEGREYGEREPFH